MYVCMYLAIYQSRLPFSSAWNLGPHNYVPLSGDSSALNKSGAELNVTDIGYCTMERDDKLLRGLPPSLSCFSL